jgi:hypothetical protein
MKYDFGTERKYKAVVNGYLQGFTPNDFIISLHKSEPAS